MLTKHVLKDKQLLKSEITGFFNENVFVIKFIFHIACFANFFGVIYLKVVKNYKLIVKHVLLFNNFK